MTGLHISSFIDQHNAAARTIARHSRLLVTDRYTNNIVASAQLVVAGGQGDWTYHTQYASGTTSWLSPGKGLLQLLVKERANGSRYIC